MLSLLLLCHCGAADLVPSELLFHWAPAGLNGQVPVEGADYAVYFHNSNIAHDSNMVPSSVRLRDYVDAS